MLFEEIDIPLKSAAHIIYVTRSGSPIYLCNTVGFRDSDGIAVYAFNDRDMTVGTEIPAGYRSEPWLVTAFVAVIRIAAHAVVREPMHR